MKTAKLTSLLLIFVGISGTFSVLFGAWLAHAGQDLPLVMQLRLNTALQYQFIHTLALFITLIWLKNQSSKWLVASALGFFGGILCFSGTLYAKTFFELAFIGKLTPFGGMLLAFSWGCLSFAGYFYQGSTKVNNANKDKV
jgi:uncharacterized membrane protein YgdD (TMEM256/DUF423 family)